MTVKKNVVQFPIFLRNINKRTGAGAPNGSLVKRELAKIFDFCLRDCKTASMRAHKKMGVLIPSVSCLRGTHETAPLGQQGEPLPSSVTAKPTPLYTKGGFAPRRKLP